MVMSSVKSNVFKKPSLSNVEAKSPGMIQPTVLKIKSAGKRKGSHFHQKKVKREERMMVSENFCFLDNKNVFARNFIIRSTINETPNVPMIRSGSW